MARERRRHDDEADDGGPVPSIKKLELNRDDLWSVAFYQKVILLCILAYFCVVITQFFLPQEIRWVLALIVVPAMLTATVFVFLLSTKVYSIPVGILLGFLTLIPCVGLLVLLIINGKATGFLKQHGVSVGLLGASLSELGANSDRGGRRVRVDILDESDEDDSAPRRKRRPQSDSYREGDRGNYQ